MKIKKTIFGLILLLLACMACAAADPQEDGNSAENVSARIYRSPEERREAGLGRQVTDWLRVSGLLEAEKMTIENNFSNDRKITQNDRPVGNLQLSFDVALVDWLTAELIFDAEYDFEARSDENALHAKWDEAFFDAELGEWGIKLGRQYVPFGEYYSHFVTGPLLEFGETRGDGVVVDYSFADLLEVAGFVFDSKVNKLGRGAKPDWGVSVNYTLNNEAIRLGLGYLSDLAESDEEFLADDNNRYAKRVSAWNAYALIGFDQFEITAEYVQANSKFREFDDSDDKPSAVNLELAYFPVATWQFAARYEHSDEFADEPADQYGIAATWAPVNRFTITAEYLYGKYKRGFVTDDDDNDQQSRDSIAIGLTYEF